jgi:hypothetical protein
MPDYGALRGQAIASIPGGGKTLAGQAADPFVLDLRVFDLLYGANFSEAGHNTLNGYNVNTIVLQLPKSKLALNGSVSRNPVIGAWSSTYRRSVVLTPGKSRAFGPYVQVSRLGNPLVNEVVVPAGLKDTFNGIAPWRDHTLAPVVNRVLNPEVPQLLQAIYGLPAPATPRKDLFEIFLTGIAKATGGPIQADLNSQLLNKDVQSFLFTPAEELRLNMAVPVSSSPSRLGVLGGDFQGFPNGRRLNDDVVDIAVLAMEGVAQGAAIPPALAGGDGVSTPGKASSSTFPYVALPYSGSVNQAG